MITLRKTITGFLLIQVQIFLKASSLNVGHIMATSLYYPTLSYPINMAIPKFQYFPYFHCGNPFQ